MQQAADEFMLDCRDNGDAPDLRPLPTPLSERMLAVIDAMVCPDYEGPLDFLVPVPLVVPTNPVVIPRSYFVAICRDAGRCIVIRQYSIEITPDGSVHYRHRAITTPARVSGRYPHVTFESYPMLHNTMYNLFWGVLFDRWSRKCERICLNNPQVRPAIEEEIGMRYTTLVRVVLQAELMLDSPKISSLMVPIESIGFTVFTRADHEVRVVNAVFIRPPTAQNCRMVQHEIRQTASNLELVYPQWSFPHAKLTAHELFNLVQPPVRKYYTRMIQTDFLKQPVNPRLRALATALHPKAIDKGCRLGDVGTDNMSRIVAFVMEAPEWGYP